MTTVIDDTVTISRTDIEDMLGENRHIISTVAGGDTEIVFDDNFYQTLADNGIEINTAGTAMLGDENDALRLPVTGGEITGDAEVDWVAELEHDGSGVSFTRNGVTVELDDLTISTETGELRSEMLVHGLVMPLGLEHSGESIFELQDVRHLNSNLDPEFDNDFIVIDDASIALSTNGARVLNEAFDIDAMEGNMRVGTATVRISTG